MVAPQKVPLDWVVLALDAHDRGFAPGDKPDITINQLAEYSQDGLISVANLKRFFRKAADFNRFKKQILLKMTHADWDLGVDKCTTAASKRYCRLKSGKKGNAIARKRLKLKVRRGSAVPPDISGSDSSYSEMSIDRESSGYGSEDVNFPTHMCKGIRKVCRSYGPGRKYQPIQPDGSEDSQINFGVAWNKKKKHRKHKKSKK